MSTATKTRTNRTPKTPGQAGNRRLPLLIAVGAALVVIISVVVIATRGGPSAPKAASAQDLATIVSRTGHGCGDFRPVPAPAQATTAAGDLGQCTSGGQPLDMAVFNSAKARDEGLLARLKGCIARRAFNTHSGLALNYVVGPNWLVASTDLATLRTLNGSLHADLRQSPC